MTDHFTLAELTHSDKAIELGIDNTAYGELTLGSLLTLANGLEQVRMLLGHPMHINSGYRSQALNRAVKGVSNSDHLLGYAADFVCPGFGTPKEIVTAIVASDIDFSQIIEECNKWVHISFKPGVDRNVLTAHFDDAGNATYTKGLA